MSVGDEIIERSLLGSVHVHLVLPKGRRSPASLVYHSQDSSTSTFQPRREIYSQHCAYNGVLSELWSTWPTITYDGSWNLVFSQSSFCRTRHSGFQGSCKSSGSSFRRVSDLPASNLESMSAQLRTNRGSMPGRMQSS
jgi:hypothetical protein